MRSRDGAGMLAMLIVLAIARGAHATTPITQPWRPAPAAAAADAGVELIAQLASHAGLSTTTTGVLTGLGLFALGFGTSSGGIILAGYGVSAVGVTAGPALGWDRAGYAGRGAVSALVRIGILGGAIVIPLNSRRTRESEFGGLVVASAALTGLVVASFEAYYECDEIAPYVRRHGPGRLAAALLPVATPSGGLGLAWVTHFD